MKSVVLAMIVLAGVLWIRIGADSFENGLYTNPKAGFAISMPGDLAETSVPNATFAVGNERGDATCVVLVQDVPGSVGPEELMKNAEQRGRGAAYTRLSWDPRNVGGVEGVRSESRMDVGGTRFRNTELHLVRDGSAVSVQCLAPEEDFDVRYLAFMRALDSFRWLD